MTDNPIAKRPVVLELPGMDAVRIERNVPYGRAGPRQRLDVYRPPEAAAEVLPAVLFVTGYADAGAETMFGCRLMDMAAYTCWARLVACVGLVGILYENEEPAADARAVLEHVRTNATSLGIDAMRLGLWSCSGNTPNALGLVAENPDLACAALVYGYTADLDGHRDVATAQAQFGFAGPANVEPTALRRTPLLLVRAGRDEAPGLNAALDRFVPRALAASVPLTLVNYPEGPHAFDILDPSSGSRAAIRQILTFLRAQLLEATDGG
jgi:acetyl esterase/lipase